MRSSCSIVPLNKNKMKSLWKIVHALIALHYGLLHCGEARTYSTALAVFIRGRERKTRCLCHSLGIDLGHCDCLGNITLKESTIESKIYKMPLAPSFDLTSN